MLNYIKTLFNRLFQKRQLLLRQNGEVGMITLSGWIQVTVFIGLLVLMVWLLVVSHAFFAQQKIITTLGVANEAQKHQWHQEKKQLQKQIHQQKSELNELTSKQLALQSLIEALPPTSDDNTKKTRPENRTPQASFAIESQHVHQLQEQLITSLEHMIESRTRSINRSLDEAGIVFQNISTVAQGGPYHSLALEQLPTHYISTIDKLVKLSELEQLITQLPSEMPVAKDDYYISSPYGFRKDPITGKRAFHKGVDLAGWHKTAIIAPAAGVVSRAGTNGGYGKFIELQHKNGITTRFGHLHTIKVKKGQTVKKSDIIALMGSTGRSTSTHLHYEVLQNNQHINPVKLTKVINRVQ
jgi:murein DD-endopeptidase MepM/ murein hydrolase activator NlpD